MMEALAAPELLCSPLRSAIHDIVPTILAGQAYLLVTLDESLVDLTLLRSLLPRLGATSEVYEYFEQLGTVQGPLLRPLEPLFRPFIPLEMAEARRYKGKTNELFTRVLLNVALFASAYRDQYAGRLRVLDPLAGGGTTLWLALAFGYDAFGIEQERQDVETSEVFVRQFLEGERISYKEVSERGRKAGHRYQFFVGPKEDRRLLVLAHGDSSEAATHMRDIAGGPRMHLIVGDLPYGIQHFGDLSGWLQRALPVWEGMLLPGGSLALAWNATRIERAAVVALIEQSTRLRVCNDAPFTQFEHAVDRVIKKRDIVVACVG